MYFFCVGGLEESGPITGGGGVIGGSSRYISQVMYHWQTLHLIHYANKQRTGKISLTSPIVINVPTRALLVV